jgi:exonuclease SbcC
MRPLELRVQGLRSYRSGHPPIDFRNRSLVAIVGNTGAGKSSLLEAMCYALFGATTWSEKAVKSLIADGERTMVVQFTFELDGTTWCVERSTSRGAYPPPAQKLWRPGDPGFQPVTKVDELNAAIRDLTHLSYESFKSAVLLPQNQFSNLLRGRDRDRALILREVFNLDEIGAVRRRAEAAVDRIRPSLEVRRGQRQRLDENPALAAESAAVRRQSAGTRLGGLRSLAGRYAALAATTTRARDEGVRLRRLTEQLAGARDDDLAGDYEPVIAADGRLTAQRAAATAELVAAEAEVSGLQVKLDVSAVDGITPESLSAARVHLTTLVIETAPAAERAAEDAAEDVAIAAEVARVAGRAGQREPLVGALTEADSAAAQADTAVEAMAIRHREALSRASTAIQAAAVATRAQTEAEARRTAVVARTAELAEREREDRVAAERWGAARTAQCEAQRRHSAAHAAQGCAPGDPCPVCDRALPDGFFSPAEPGLSMVDAELAATGSAATAANGRLEAARVSLATATGEAETAANRATAAAAEAVAAVERLREMLPGVDLDVDARTTAGPLAEEERAARVRQAAMHETVAEARAAVVGFDTETSSLATALEQRRGRLTARRRETATLLTRLERARAEIPESLRPAQNASAEGLADAVRAVADETDRLAAITTRQHAAAQQAAAATRRLREIATAHATDVAGQAARLWQRVARHAAALTAAQQALGREASTLDAELDLAGQAAAALEIRRLAAELCAELDSRALAEERAASEADDDAVSLLCEAGIDSWETLATTIHDLDVESGVAAAEEFRMRAQIPLAVALGAALGPAEVLVTALDQVRRWMAEGGAFERFVSAERQRTLLDVGSDILHRMTRERYRFSPDFEVVSMDTGQARSTSTLSGGETFLASLALALAMVQVNVRAGGHLDTLILDEGFGSLDDESLQLALEELSRRAAEKDAFVAVVSHLGAVAQNADDVLYVTHEATGSRARWRDEISTEEMQMVERQLHWE